MGCLKNEKFPCSEGNQSRDFLHVNDVVDAIIKSLINKNAKGQIINIGIGLNVNESKIRIRIK